VSFAKGVTSAYLPLGGVIISRKVHETMRGAPADQKFMHAATYSGHPACCAVGLRNVELIESENLVERSAIMGRRLLAGLESLRDLPNVGEVRPGRCAHELVEKKETKALAISGPRVAKEALST
jgi:adenosylmethionine-8-amino-7-oxononanoate aminotransferase